MYGVIFLFKYPVGQKKTDEAVDGQYDFEASENIFFANQTIQNACATQAILSVLLNRGDLEVGDSLTEFREFTQAFPAEVLTCWLLIPRQLSEICVEYELICYSSAAKLYQTLVSLNCQATTNSIFSHLIIK